MSTKRFTKLLRYALFILLFGMALAIFSISRGVFDPTTVGELTQQLTVSPVAAQAGQSRIEWQAAPLGSTFSIKVDGTQQTPNSVGYGIAIGRAEQHISIAVSTYGYTRHWAEGIEIAPLYTRHWHPWPHVQPDTNQLWLNVEEKALSVRINGERYWEATLPPDFCTSQPCQLGLYTEGLDGPNVIHFEPISLYFP